MQKRTKRSCAAPLLIALCTIAVACNSRSESGQENADSQREPKPVEEESTAVPVRDFQAAGHAAISAECIGRVQGEEFCDGSAVRACLDGTASALQRCGQRERCVTMRDRVLCACEPGTVDTGAGCQIVASCSAGTGRCDPLTQCSVVADKRTCGPCPTGYIGNGERGCQPVLTGLAADGGELVPALAPDVRSYRVKLPPTRERLSLTPAASNGVQIEVDGAKVSAGPTWTSPVLAPGEHAIALVLTGPNGITTRYEVIVERPES